jgi:hypothetical protein
MPVVDESAARCHTGLYRFLYEAEEVEFRRWEEGQRRRIANGYNAGSYPRQRRLDAFGSALPVNVAAGENWGWNAVNAGAPPVARPAGRLPARVIVRPDDTLTYTDDGWAALFIEEHGL